jgi:aldose 1-epimerase
MAGNSARTGGNDMQIADFGHTSTGTPVHCISISAGDLSSRILTLGATLRHVGLNGLPHSLTLGSDRVTDYETEMRYFGALVGPVANRIAAAQTTVNGKTLRFDPNNNGNLLHGGTIGLHYKIWAIANTAPDSVTLTLTLPEGEDGWPGTRHIEATFRIIPPATLRLTIAATTDAPGLMNIANHSYWNLDGSDAWQGHSLRIAADHILPVDAALIPTGQIAAVADTAFDFRTLRPLIPGQPPLDTNFCLSAAKAALRDVATLVGGSGVTLTLATTEPGLQIYDASRSARPGKSPYEGLAIEAQGWPDAPNHANFPSVQISPENPYSQTTEWRFSKP